MPSCFPIMLLSWSNIFPSLLKPLNFDRKLAYGKRLNIPSGTAIRFEPGQSREVELIEYKGKKIVFGFNALINSKLKEV